MKPQHIGRLKVFHSINTSQLEGHGGHPHGNNHTANDIFEDVFIRRFIMGVFYSQYIPDMGIGIIRRLNEIEVNDLVHFCTSFKQYWSTLHIGQHFITKF